MSSLTSLPPAPTEPRSSGGKDGTDDRFYKVIFNGKAVWARASSSGGGKHDGIVYVEEVP